MIKLCMFSYNFAYTIMNDNTVLKESKQSFYSAKNSPMININGKLQKHFFKMSDTPHLACSVVG